MQKKCKLRVSRGGSSIIATGIPVFLLISAFGFAQAARVRTLPPPAKRFALLIGVGKYSHGISPLDGPTHDVVALKKALVSFAGFDEKNVLTLSSDSAPEELPTRDNIIVQLNSLKPRLAGGLLLVAFSGHGFYKFHTPFLLTYEAVDGDINDLTQTSLPVSSLQKKLQTINAKQIILMLDACQSDPESSKGSGDNLMAKEFAKAFEDLIIQPSQASAVLYATRPPERAYINDASLGYFTAAIAEALSGKANKVTGGPPVTLSDLTAYVEKEVPVRVEESKQRKQEPDHRFIRYDGSTILVDPSWVDQPFTSGTRHRVHFQRIGTANDCAQLPSESRVKISLARKQITLYAPAGCDIEFFVPAEEETNAAQIQVLDASYVGLSEPNKTYDTKSVTWNAEIVDKGSAVRISAFELVDAPTSPDFYQIVQQRLGAVAGKVSGFRDLGYVARLELVRTGRKLSGSLADQATYAQLTNSLQLLSGVVSVDSKGQSILHLALLIPRVGTGTPFIANLDLGLNDYATLNAVYGSSLLFALLEDAIRTKKPQETIALLREETYFALKQIDPFPAALMPALNEVTAGH